ncbi:hypothetical protein BD410DRAFT_120394 [Rickenella mellea]|uniref:BTB domain-containing protein n=1 Tax=Rickenella mellea TaxID=50990 RepID=A0A4Y7PJ83_9AGAM|nr:hypothetical protein BD410DRAFT_120394 [Rickenella mellea]
MADQCSDDVDMSASQSLSNVEFHKSYSDPDADIIIQSGDGVQFRIHSLIMKMASGFFRDMLGLPGNIHAEEPIVMAEKAEIIVVLLGIIYPNVGLPKIRPELTWDVAAAADRYDMVPVIETMSHIVASDFNAGQLGSILTYSLACRYGWRDVAKAASKKTLDINLSSLDESQLARIDNTSFHSLHKLHRTRRHALFALMDMNFSLVSHRVVFQCCIKDTHFGEVKTCCKDRGNSPLWILLKQSVFKEMEEFSSGRTLHEDKFWLRMEFGGLWSSASSHDGSGFTIDKRATGREALGTDSAFGALRSSGFGLRCTGSCLPFDRLATKREVLRVLNSVHVPSSV